MLAVTLGDVAGIGPEITAKTLLQHPELREICVPVVIGDEDAMRIGADSGRLDPDTVRVITDPRAAANDATLIELVQTGGSLADVPVGKLDPRAGDGAYRFVVEACRLARDGIVDGIVTAPLNKAAMQAGGHKWPGHTELLAHEFGVENFSLVLSAGDLYFFHLTAHVSLQQAIENTTAERTDDISPWPGPSFAPSESRTRPSASAVSTRMPARTGSSVTRTPTSSNPLSPGPGSAASTPTDPSQPTR